MTQEELPGRNSGTGILQSAQLALWGKNPLDDYGKPFACGTYHVDFSPTEQVAQSQVCLYRCFRLDT